MNARNIIIACFIVLLSTRLCANQLTPEQMAAKEQGIALFNQHKAISAEPYLSIAAEAGDRESQFYLGKAIQFNKRYMTAEAKKWYAAAAEQGDLYAMFQLYASDSDLCHAMHNCPPDTRTSQDWKNLIIKTAEPLASHGDGEAMYILFLTTKNLDWLEKSADAGFPFGQYWLAEKYEDGRGFFFPPWQRSERVMELYKEAAQGGYPPAMYGYAVRLVSKGDPDGARSWLMKCAETGYESGLSDYAYSLSTPDNRWGIPTDYVKSYALMALMLELNGGGNVLVFINGELPRIAKHLTSEQLEEAKKIGEEWKATHPPLSFYPQKLGF
jgi:TPR repeat protein